MGEVAWSEIPKGSLKVCVSKARLRGSGASTPLIRPLALSPPAACLIGSFAPFPFFSLASLHTSVRFSHRFAR